MSDLELQILDIIQDGFPVENRPYAVIAEKLGKKNGLFSEQTVFEAVESLRVSGVIRRVGGVYDTKRLGLVSRLCAGKVPSDKLDFCESSVPRPATALEKFATVALEIPAVTHNYVRSHDYNVWFTVIAESELEIQKTVDKLCAESSLGEVHMMPARRMFKINTVMVSDERKNAAASNAANLTAANFDAVNSDAAKLNAAASNAANLDVPSSDARLNVSPSTSAPLTEADRKRIRLLSGDLPHSLTPFADLGVSLEEIFSDLSSGRMRRLGAVLRHQQAGFPCNAMVCFDIEACSASLNADAVDFAGAILAANPHVSHCYERPPFEGFAYNVYAMFHAHCESDLMRFVGEAAAALGNPRYAVLHSVRELKKTSYKYFAE